MGAKEISCPQCGSPISLRDIRKSSRSAVCDSCGTEIDIRSELAVARRRMVVVRNSKIRFSPNSIILLALSAVWLAGALLFSPLQWLEQNQLILVMGFVLYIGVGCILLLAAVWTILRSRARY